MLVVDDSVVPRAAAKSLLAAAKGLRFVGEAASAQEAFRQVAALKPDLVLMDVHLPEVDGPQASRELLAQHPSVKVIAWTVSEASDDLLRMMQAGCSGYVLKEAGPAELQNALLSVARSQSPVPRRMIPEVLRRVAERTPLSQPGPAPPLTSREMQILRGLAKGLTTKRLAHELGLRSPSVDTHIQNLFRKLDVNNRGEAVSTAMRLGLLTLADF